MSLEAFPQLTASLPSRTHITETDPCILTSRLRLVVVVVVVKKLSTYTDLSIQMFTYTA